MIGRKLGVIGCSLVMSAMTFELADGASASTYPNGSISLVAYSTPAPAYTALINLFNKTKQGKNVSVSTSFGASGSQSKAVVAGLPADVVNFSLTTDVERLVPKLVAPTWNQNAEKGIVTDSVVVFVTPKGNPEHIKSWNDLLKPGVRVFTPNPFSSGSARWNIMAAYGAELKLGKSPANAQAYLNQLLTNTVVQGSSAATEFQAFLADESANKKDVFLDYEDDAIQAIRAHRPVSYVIPNQTILIANPLAVVKTSSNLAAAQDFYNYLFSYAGQSEWAKLGYRPTLPQAANAYRKRFPRPPGLFTIASLGGWDTVANTFFGTSNSSPGIVTQIEKSLGQSTSSS